MASVGVNLERLMQLSQSSSSTSRVSQACVRPSKIWILFIYDMTMTSPLRSAHTDGMKLYLPGETSRVLKPLLPGVMV